MCIVMWFVVRKPTTGGIIAISAHQVVHRGTKMLYYIHQTQLSSRRAERGSGYETRIVHNVTSVCGSVTPTRGGCVART